MEQDPDKVWQRMDEAFRRVDGQLGRRYLALIAKSDGPEALQDKREFAETLEHIDDLLASDWHPD